MTATLVSAWTAARKRLEAVGVESPAVDARLLLEAAAGVARIDILTDPHRELTPEQAERLEAFLVRREAREPVSQIVGRRAFWTLNLRVTPDVLTPRPETERLLDIALALLPADRAFTALDLGLGSGAILLALLAERPLARGVGVEISDAALQIARENAAELGLAGRADLRLGDWTEGLADGAFDLVLANPPYIPTAEIATLEPEVREHEPRLALDGGLDGLDAYRRLAPEILRVLKPGGLFAVEIGPEQGAAVEALFKAAGAVDLARHPDLTRRERIVAGSKKPLGNPPVNR
jgi:release factor glutamine methyltransferase